MMKCKSNNYCLLNDHCLLIDDCLNDDCSHDLENKSICQSSPL